MSEFFEFIVFILISYKVMRLLFAEDKARQTVSKRASEQNRYTNNHQQNNSSSDSKFNDAEFIDYEEVK